jgi:hypothetical protein
LEGVFGGFGDRFTGLGHRLRLGRGHGSVSLGSLAKAGLRRRLAWAGTTLRQALPVVIGAARRAAR